MRAPLTLMALGAVVAPSLARAQEGGGVERIAEVVRDVDGDGHVDRAGEQLVVRGTVTGTPIERLFGERRGARFYVQDVTGGIRIEGAAWVDLALGDVLQVRGVLGEYRGMPTLAVDAGGSVEVVRSSSAGGARPIPPKEVQLARLNREATCGSLVRVRGAVAYEGKHYCVDQGEDRLRLFLRPASAFQSFTSDLQEGDTIDVTGHLEQYAEKGALFGGYRLRPRDVEDVLVIDEVAGAVRGMWLLWVGVAAVSLAAAAGLLLWQQRRGAGFESPEAQRMHALGTMSGGVAHEFNNYLLAIAGFAELARDESPEGSEVRQHLNEVLAASSRAKALIDQILSFSRTKEDELVPLDLSKALRESLQLLRGVMPASVQLVSELSSACGEVVADPGQISQVILNLGANASNAMPQGGVLTVSLEQVELPEKQRRALGLPQAEAYAMIQVEDTGCGMGAEVRRRAFDPFFTTRRQAEGTGLGLSVVHGIIKRHRGAIDLRSAPSEGAKFRIYLPVQGEYRAPAGPVGASAVATDDATDDAAASPGVAPPASAGVGETGPGAQQASESRCVLVVDDQRNLTALLERLLAQLGLRTKIANDGDAAIRALTSSRADYCMVLSDLAMPNMTGIELAERVRAERPGLPFVLMTGNASGLDDSAVEAAGILRVVTKPFGLSDLRELIEDVLPARG